MPIHPFLLLKMVNCLIFVGFQLCFPPKKIFTNMSVNLSSSSHPTINNRFDVRYCLHPAQTKCFLSGFDVLGTVKCRSQILQYRSGPSFGTPSTQLCFLRTSRHIYHWLTHYIRYFTWVERTLTCMLFMPITLHFSLHMKPTDGHKKRGKYSLE